MNSKEPSLFYDKNIVSALFHYYSKRKCICTFHSKLFNPCFGLNMISRVELEGQYLQNALKGQKHRIFDQVVSLSIDPVWTLDSYSKVSCRAKKNVKLLFMHLNKYFRMIVSFRTMARGSGGLLKPLVGSKTL